VSAEDPPQFDAEGNREHHGQLFTVGRLGAAAMALANRASAAALDGWVFFDRGSIDAAAGLQHLTGDRCWRVSLSET
jgi:predicted ATPase